MGYYIEGKSQEDKVLAIKDNAIEEDSHNLVGFECPDFEKWIGCLSEDNDVFPICIVDNGMFLAVAIAWCPEEGKCCANNDGRSKVFVRCHLKPLLNRINTREAFLAVVKRGLGHKLKHLEEVKS